MSESTFVLDFQACQTELLRRLHETAPSRIQLLTGPRQVGKTTLLLAMAKSLGESSLYTSADGPEASLPGYWERLWHQLQVMATSQGQAYLLLDEAPYLSDWSGKLKGEWDRIVRLGLPIHVVASGSSALAVGAGSRESLAGRFERLTLGHWGARALANAFSLSVSRAAEALVLWGSFPGAWPLHDQPDRWLAYLRDAIQEPALGRDLVALTQVRKPALLRQLFTLAAATPAQIVSLQKLQGQLQDRGALETVAHYLSLLKDAYLVTSLEKYSATLARRRAAPPKLITLNNAFLRLAHPAGPDTPDRWGAWLENACLAHCVNSGQQVTYWREEPVEVDAVIQGSWGNWALEITLGEVRSRALEGLAEFTRRNPQFEPLVICPSESVGSAQRLGIAAQDWQSFLWEGPKPQRVRGI